MFADDVAGTWVTTTVSTSELTTAESSVSFFADGTPVVGYPTTAGLTIARREGPNWSQTTVLPGTFYELVMRVSPDDRVCLAYPSAGRLLYAEWDGTHFTSTDIDTIAGAGHTRVDLAFDSQDQPCLVYSQSSSAVKFARRESDGTWTTEIAADPQEVPDCVRLVLDDQDQPHLSYNNDTYGGLWHATRITGMWHSEQVSGGRDGGTSSIAIDAQGKIGIAFIDYSDNSLEYALKTDAGWILESIPGTSRTQNLSLCYAGNMAHIGLTDIIGNDTRQIEVAIQIPEPATLSLLALGGLALVRRRRR